MKHGWSSGGAVAWGLVVGVGMVVGAGCGAAPPAGNTTPAPIANQAPPPALSCKDAVERASASVAMDPHDLTTEIGECEQYDWPVAARECVAAATTEDALAACGPKFQLAKRGVFADHTSSAAAFTAMNKFRGEMCACKDSACAQKVSEDMTRWGQQMAKEEPDPPKLTEEDTRRFTQLGEALGKCMQAAMAGGGGTP